MVGWTSPRSRSLTCSFASCAENSPRRPAEAITSRRCGVAAMSFGIRPSPQGQSEPVWAWKMLPIAPRPPLFDREPMCARQRADVSTGVIPKAISPKPHWGVPVRPPSGTMRVRPKYKGVLSDLGTDLSPAPRSQIDRSKAAVLQKTGNVEVRVVGLQVAGELASHHVADRQTLAAADIYRGQG